MRKINISCTSWDEVEDLCDKQSSGKNTVTLKGTQNLAHGERLMVALSLPDELVLSFAAEVSSVRKDPLHGDIVTAVFLVGLTPEICARMRSLCNENQPRRPSYVKKSKRPQSGPGQEPGHVIGVLGRKPDED